MSLLTLDQFLSQSPVASFPPRGCLVGDDAPEGEPTRQSMYLVDKPRGVYFCNNAGLTPPEPQQEQMVLAESSDDDHEVKAPKKRAETWAQEETRCLITFRREIDGLFNTSKSNKHLWEQISAKMREKGYDRSPTMCTDKWRNLLKEFKKAKHQSKGRGSAKMSSYKELDELLKERSKKAGCKVSSASKVNAYLQFSDKGLEDANAPFGPAEGSDRSPLNLDRSTEHDRHPLAIMAIDAVAASGVPPWNWRDTSVNDNNASYRGRVILVKWGDYLRRIGIDGTREAIKEAIKSAFGLRTKRAFWLEDEDNVVRCLDREMPIGSYTLHLDEGITIKLCIYDENDRMPMHTEEKTLYTEDELHLFLLHRGWAGLREITGLKNVDTLDDLCPGGLYQGMRMLVD